MLVRFTAAPMEYAVIFHRANAIGTVSCIGAFEVWCVNESSAHYRTSVYCNFKGTFAHLPRVRVGIRAHKTMQFEL